MADRAKHIHDMVDAYSVLAGWVEALLVARTPDQRDRAIVQLARAHAECAVKFREALDRLHAEEVA